ncbi:MAG: Fe-S cluster assembly ATPase SufC [Candidatus Parvarchaeota archaeon]|nr:Fe-S cluster assembly ATPase SufC [Candidatus Parvarchaeota archaeon]
MLEIEDLQVNAGEKQIIHDINITVESGKIVVLMGPNGSGKSTLCKSIMGDPSYHITKGRVKLDGEDITSITTYEKAKHGLFMVFQEPEEIDGLSALRFMRSAYLKLTNKKGDDFLKRLEEAKKMVQIKEDLLANSLNTTASGGEKKKLEILQMIIFGPKYALIDEFDSGLDVDSIKKISKIINELGIGSLVVTHNPAVLNHLNVDTVHIINNGGIVASGGPELANRIEKEGFAWAQKKS